MEILFNVLLLVVGFVALIKGADFFVEGASGIADRFGIPQIVIGLTIVAFGTSAPEAAISISAAVSGSTGIAIGNIIGSNIMNILLILGITACITPLPVQKNTAKIEIPFMLAITVLLVVLGAVFEELDWIVGIILWAIFIAFFVYLLYISKKQKKDEISKAEQEVKKKRRPLWMLILFTILGLVGIVIGSQLTVNSATEIARTFGVSERIIGLTIIAFGTSLPELITSITAARKGKNDIAIGNIVGSNIFNILFVLGTTSLIKAVPYSGEFLFDGILAIAAVALLLIGVQNKERKLKRPMGIAMLAIYAVYFVFLLMK